VLPFPTRYGRDPSELAKDPGFHAPRIRSLAGESARNPAEVLITALNEANLDNRVTEGLPWLLWRTRTWIGIGGAKRQVA